MVTAIGTSRVLRKFVAAFACALGLGALFGAASVHASFHTFRIAELYTDVTGNVQFVELLELSSFDDQDLFFGQMLTSRQGLTERVYTFGTNLPSRLTANKRVLIATPGFASLGVVTPDYIIPAPFLFPGGGMLNFAGVDFITYPPLPTDGLSSIDRDGIPGTNSPTNFAGQSGSVPCSYSLAPTDLSNTVAAGGSPNITVTTPAGCPVTATSFQPWVTVNGVTPSGGTTTVSLQVSPNAGAARATAIRVADRLFLITQLAP